MWGPGDSTRVRGTCHPDSGSTVYRLCLGRGIGRGSYRGGVPDDPLLRSLLPAVVALAAVWWPTAWSVTRHVVTVVHEGAHGVVGRVCGRSIRGIRLHSDSSGLTVSRGRPRGPGMVATLFAGYVGPGLLGLAIAGVLETDRYGAVLWGLLVLLALLLLQIRNLYGLWVVVVCGAVLVGLTGWADAGWQRAAAEALAWFFLLAAPRGVVAVVRERRAGRGRTSDPDQLAAITALPAGLWVALMMLLDLACLGLGAWLLLPPLAG